VRSQQKIVSDNKSGTQIEPLGCRFYVSVDYPKKLPGIAMGVAKVM
jgi:hypothetical protein